MKKKVISKLEIIQALATEPLRTGNFYRAGAAGCNVCAVGALLRRSFPDLPKNEDAFTVAGERATKSSYASYQKSEEDQIKEAMNLLRSRNYMGALSTYFEATVSGLATPQDRENLIQFVYKNFPERVTLTC